MIVVKNWMREIDISDWIRIGQQKNNVVFSWRPKPQRCWISRNGDIIMGPMYVDLPLRQQISLSHIPTDEKKTNYKGVTSGAARLQIKSGRRICKRGKR